MSKDQRQVWMGIFSAVFSLAIVFGAFALTLAQSGASNSVSLILPTRWQTATLAPTALPGEPTFTPVPPSPTFTSIPPVTCPPPTGWMAVVIGPDDTFSSLAAVYGTTPEILADGNCWVAGSLLPGAILYVPPLPSPTPPRCQAPAGWQPVVVGAADTLFSLAARYAISAEALAAGNCLAPGTALLPGSVIYVPPSKPPAPTVCTYPWGWVPYIVRPGDTLYSIGVAFGVSALELQMGNCLPSSYIEAGWTLRVPFVITPTPFWPPTLSPPTLTFPPTATFIPSPTFTASPPLPTRTPTGTPTGTPAPTLTATRTPTISVTPTSTQMATHTPTGTATQTPTPMATGTATQTPTLTATGTATQTPAPTATVTNTPTLTPTEPPTATFTPTNTTAPTATPTETLPPPSPTPSVTSTSAPSP